MRNRFKLVLIGMCFISSSVAAEVLITSPDTRVGLLELYTSEGCSSCPPADKWLSKLKQDKRLWSSLVPVAFHVDYWDYIGWKDRFASPEYSLRQRDYARSKNLKTVYTPGFLLNGKEWRSFFGLKRLSVGNQPGAGVLSLRLDGSNVTANYLPEKNEKNNLIVNIALLGFDISTDVNAGENHGRTLKHDFVVLGYKTAALNVSGNGYSASMSRPVPVVNAGKYGLAAWVNTAQNLAPIQAAGGYIDIQ